jgi:hypothetical protein
LPVGLGLPIALRLAVALGLAIALRLTVATRSLTVAVEGLAGNRTALGVTIGLPVATCVLTVAVRLPVTSAALTVAIGLAVTLVIAAAGRLTISGCLPIALVVPWRLVVPRCRCLSVTGTGAVLVVPGEFAAAVTHTGRRALFGCTCLVGLVLRTPSAPGGVPTTHLRFIPVAKEDGCCQHVIRRGGTAPD